MDDSFNNVLASLEDDVIIEKSNNINIVEKSNNINIVEKNKNISPTNTISLEEQAGTSKSTSKSHGLQVNIKQKGNPLLKAITNVPWEFDESIVPDYQMGHTVCALFLSLKYHNLNPDYIHERLKLLGKKYELRVLLVLIDLDDPHQPLKTLSRICILADLTLMLAWSFDEAGKIIETYKIYESKPADAIMEKSETSPHLKLVQALTSIKPVNKTDAMTLIARFGSLKNIIEASEFQLSQCPGLGPRKASKLYAVLHENFCRKT